MKKVVFVVKFSAERGLPFRGQNEEIGSDNNSDFIGIIELLAQSDAFLADNLNRLGNAGRVSFRVFHQQFAMSLFR